MGESVKAVKVRRGLYRLEGVTHTEPRYPGASVCGGQVFAQRHPDESRDDGVEVDMVLPSSWECFCEKCLDCDPNGWATLAECVLEAPAFWCATSGVPAAGRRG